MKWKEIAKFFAGLTAWESVVHASLALSKDLPIKLIGFTIDEKINTLQIIVPAICSILLVWYGWIYKPKLKTE